MANPDSHDMQLQLEVLAPEFSVCKMGAHDPIPDGLAERAYCFIGRTPDELSIVCESAAAPAAAAEREDGWRALKVAGPLDFGLVGILAKICQALADAAIPVFAISTYDTDYVLVKAGSFEAAIDAREAAGACGVGRGA